MTEPRGARNQSLVLASRRVLITCPKVSSMLRRSPFAWHSSRVRESLSLLLLSVCSAGCAADDLEEKQEGPATLEQQGSSSEAAILSISALGTGCPAGSTDVTIARDGLSAEVRFDRFEAVVDDDHSFSVKDCQLAVELRDMNDVQYEVSSRLSGWTSLESGQNARITQVGYLQGNAGEAERATREIDGPRSARFSASGATVETSCGPARNVNLRTTIRLENADDRAAGRVSLSDARDAAQTITVTSRRCR